MRLSMDERRANVDLFRSRLAEMWQKLDEARRGRAKNARSWLWRRIWGRAWARHVAQWRWWVQEAVWLLRFVMRERDKEHAWMVLNQNVDRRLANWIRARHGIGPYAPPRPPPSPTELAWAAYMFPGKDENGRRLPRDPALRPIQPEEPRPVEQTHAPGAPSSSVLIYEGQVRGVEQDDRGRFRALILSDNGTLKSVLITDVQAKALAERCAAEEASADE